MGVVALKLGDEDKYLFAFELGGLGKFVAVEQDENGIKPIQFTKVQLDAFDSQLRECFTEGGMPIGLLKDKKIIECGES